MKNTLFALGTAVLFLGSAAVAFATGPQTLSFYCDSYTQPFASGGLYDPDGSNCTYILPAIASSSIEMTLYQGTPGSATPMRYNPILSPQAPSNTVVDANFFGTPPNGTQFFAVAYGFDSFGELSNADTYFQCSNNTNDVVACPNGGGAAPLEYFILPFAWGPPLAVTADDQTVSVGSSLPTFTATLSGFASGDTTANSTIGSASCSTTAPDTSTIGNYPINCAQGTLSSSKYSFSPFFPGTLHVVAASASAPLTLTADGKTMAYGDPIPTLTGTLSGFVNGDTATSNDVTGSPSCSTSATSASPAGTYPIVCSVGTLVSAGHYTFSTFVPGTLTISQAPLTVTATNASVMYGNFILSLSAIFSGFVNGETLGTSDIIGTPSCTTTATPSSPVGSYPITCTLGTLASNNYSFTTFFPGFFTITKAPLTVTADNKIITFGSTIPPLTATISGFVNGDSSTSNDVAGAANCSTTATNASLPGNYPITCTLGTLASNNYSFSNFVAGTLSIAYRCDGFSDPINNHGHEVKHKGGDDDRDDPGSNPSIFKGGSTIPVKFYLQKADGSSASATTSPLWFAPQKGGSMSSSVDESYYSDPTSDGTTYNYNGGKYQYNWSTKGLQNGYWYRIYARLGNGQYCSVTIGLR